MNLLTKTQKIILASMLTILLVLLAAVVLTACKQSARKPRTIEIYVPVAAPANALQKTPSLFAAVLSPSPSPELSAAPTGAAYLSTEQIRTADHFLRKTLLSSLSTKKRCARHMA